MHRQYGQISGQLSHIIWRQFSVNPIPIGLYLTSLLRQSSRVPVGFVKLSQPHCTHMSICSIINRESLCIDTFPQAEVKGPTYLAATNHWYVDLSRIRVDIELDWVAMAVVNY